MRKGIIGKLFVKYGEAINLSDYIQKNQDSKENISMRLTSDLYQIQQREQPITMNSLISAALCHYPLPKMTIKYLKSSVKLTYDHILRKEYKTYISSPPQNHDINQAVLNLGFQIKGNPMDKKIGDQAIIDLSDKESNFISMLGLSYYANQFGVYFSLESIISHSANLLLKRTGSKIMDLAELTEIAKVIFNIFRNEFMPMANELDELD